MGQSSGASSAHLHMMSRLSQNYFNKVILLSGNGNGPYAYVIRDPLGQARKYARESGIKNGDNMTTEMLANELRKVDVNKLIDATDAFKVWSVDPLTVSRPVVEDCSKNEGFLCDNPVTLWNTGNYKKMSMLTGFMEGDGAVRVLGMLSNKTQLDDLNAKFDSLFPKLQELDILNGGKVNTDHVKLIKDQYLNGKSSISHNDLKNLIKLYTDRSFYTPMVNTLAQMLENDRKSAGYLYKFNFKGRYSYSVFYTGSLTDYGTVHCDELIYLLKSPVLFPIEFEVGSKEAAFRRDFNKFITFFAAHGYVLVGLF
jgi:juvenile-hormone esterase